MLTNPCLNLALSLLSTSIICVRELRSLCADTREPSLLSDAISVSYLGDNCIQNFHLGRYMYIVGYTVGNLVLRRRASGAVKRDFRTYIRRFTSKNENLEYGYPHSNALLQFELKLERCKPHKPARHPTKGDVINDVKLFPTVYRRIYCRKFFTLSNQTCIRIYGLCVCTGR